MTCCLLPEPNPNEILAEQKSIRNNRNKKAPLLFYREPRTLLDTSGAAKPVINPHAQKTLSESCEKIRTETFQPVKNDFHTRKDCFARKLVHF